LLQQVTRLMSSAAFLVACHMCTYINKIIVCNSSCWQIKYDDDDDARGGRQGATPETVSVSRRV